MVVAEFRDAYPSRGSLYLVVRNYGQSVARNVQVTFSPEIADPPAAKEHESVIPFLKKRYVQPIAVLTPGTELSNVYYASTPGTNGKFENWEDVPDQITVTLKYTSADEKQEYTDSYRLDVDLFMSGTSIRSSESLEAQVKNISRSLKDIAKHLETIKRDK
ncbi:hypothetical protein [Streptomyces sp. NPDC008125]|uniref:hypothetical protein n=1 Tax=Streptomyces sp. NPDC008125 TaxID=3364811 RepID=UPI0036EBE113